MLRLGLSQFSDLLVLENLSELAFVFLLERFFLHCDGFPLDVELFEDFVSVLDLDFELGDLLLPHFLHCCNCFLFFQFAVGVIGLLFSAFVEQFGDIEKFSFEGVGGFAAEWVCLGLGIFIEDLLTTDWG